MLNDLFTNARLSVECVQAFAYMQQLILAGMLFFTAPALAFLTVMVWKERKPRRTQ